MGLCHGVQHGHNQIAQVLGLKRDEIDIICAGINHQTWYVSVKAKGRDCLDKILGGFKKHPEYSQTEKVRMDMIKRFGYYSTESNGHLSEYLPWYRKRRDDIKNWIDLNFSWANGETGGYLRVVTEGRNWFENEFGRGKRPETLEYTLENRSDEHGSHILEALETGRVYRGHFNMVNDGTISNLPVDAIIEAPGFVDRHGINMIQVGDLPLGCAAVCNASISVQRLGVEAAVHGDDQLLRQAFMMDPLTGAVCNPPEIWQMVDELLVAQAKWLPQYKRASNAAKRRLKKGPLIKAKARKGAARRKTRSLAELKRVNKGNPRAGH